ncbi:hypothetical protein ACVFI8_17320 [Agarivorans sp. MS3-6]|uniref:hypothetical protein n=1 Tax=Agarivorans sp. TSD2052 TaxID=2937286 RepID=UPI00200D7276|nr:hypothetical protein [Agarivorans sp. TSD2052]UPW17391.1 hypothetical protein M0C34_14210 [Agarivorans sp. TSD2052]
MMNILYPLALALGGAILVSTDQREQLEQPTIPSKLEIIAIDGKLENAQVWLDRNNNFICDLDEPSATSNKFGKASLNITAYPEYSKSPIVVMAIAGQTIDQHLPNKTISHSYLMSAPAGQTEISPLSTLVHLEMINQGGQTLSSN